MAEINIPTTVTAPDQIQVELVRADHVQTTSVFRTFFEVFLSATSTLFGFILSEDKVTTIHWCFFSIMSGACIAFLIMTIRLHKNSRHKK